MDEFMGIIKIFAGTFAPVGWLPCDGRLLPISQYDTLFALLGTQYGGDGVSTFGLPDLRSCVAVGAGRNYQSGAIGGSDSVSLTIAQLPIHNHPAVVTANGTPGTTGTPQANYLLAQSNGSTGSGEDMTVNLYSSASAQQVVQLSPNSVTGVSYAGGSQPHDNMQPYLAMIYCICVEGIWPSQN